MADQDFTINIRTLADTTGIKLTQEGLAAIQQAAKQGNVEAIEALKKLSAAQKEAQAASQAQVNTGGGFTGTAAGVGTIALLIGYAARQITEFSKEQDKIIEKMEEAREKTYELGLSVADTLEAMQSLERINTEPLEFSFDRLKNKVGELKTELKLAFESGDYKASEKLISQLRVVESQFDRVSMSIYRKGEASKKAAEEAEKDAEASAREAQDFLTKAVQTAQPQVQAVLKNEERARQARAAGQEKDADLYQKTADQLKSSLSQSQREEYEGFIKPTRLGRKAGPGESQDIVDDIARNQINNQRALAGQPPLPPQGSPGGAGGNQDLTQAIQQAFDGVMAKYWGP